MAGKEPLEATIFQSKDIYATDSASRNSTFRQKPVSLQGSYTFAYHLDPMVQHTPPGCSRVYSPHFPVFVLG